MIDEETIRVTALQIAVTLNRYDDEGRLGQYSPAVLLEIADLFAVFISGKYTPQEDAPL